MLSGHLSSAARLIAAFCLAVALVPLTASPIVAQGTDPACPADVGGVALSEELPDDQGDVQVLRCRYGPGEGISLVKLAGRWNPPGASPTLEGGCGGAGRRAEDTDANTITGTVFSGLTMSRVVWDVGNTRRNYDEEAVLAAAQALLAGIEPLGQPCPNPTVGAGTTVADECAAELGVLTLSRAVRSQDDPDEVTVKCFYAGTSVSSTVQYFMAFNPPDAEETLATACGRAATAEEQDGQLIGLVYGTLSASRVRYVIGDTSLGYSQDEVITGAEALLATIADEAIACDLSAAPPTAAPTTTAGGATTATTAPGTTVPSETTVAPGEPTSTAVAAGEGGGGSGLLLPVVVVVLAASGGAAFLLYRRRNRPAGSS